MARTVVLKLGGSLITDKKVPYCLRPQIIKAVSKEIKDCLNEKLVDQLIVVHGVGSYGHPPVIEHKLYKGFIDKSQLMPISKTQSKVMELRMALTSAFQEAGIPVVMLHTSSIASAEKGQIVTMDVAAVRGFLKVGMIPLLGGDMVQDSVMGFSVGSGDQVARVLAKEFRSSDLIFATDVAGVYDVDPKANPLARPLKELSLANLMNVSSGEGMVDASGAMRGKLSNLEGLAQELKTGLRASIISMMEPGNLKGVLKGVEFKGTWIRP